MIYGYLFVSRPPLFRGTDASLNVCRYTRKKVGFYVCLMKPITLHFVMILSCFDSQTAFAHSVVSSVRTFVVRWR